MATTSVTSIRGITKPRAELLRRAGITSLAELAGSSPEEISSIMARSGETVGLKMARRWLVEARNLEAQLWTRSASFVVSFEMELAEGPERRRRTVVEQTEVDVDLVQSTVWDGWEGWECSELCEWMRRHLEEEPAPPDEEPARPEEASVVEAESTPAPPAPLPAYRLVRVTLVDPQGKEAVVPPGNGSSVPVQVAGVARVKVELASTEDAPPLVGVRIIEPGTGARQTGGPVELPPGRETVDVALSGSVAGSCSMVVAVWDPGGRLAPVAEIAQLVIGAAPA